MTMNRLYLGMNKSRTSQIAIAVILIAAMLAGCAPAAATPMWASTSVQPTVIPPTSVQPSPAAQTMSADPAYYTNEPIAVVPTPIEGQPLIKATANTSIRSGPGTNYVAYGAFVGGSTAVAVGVSADGGWFAISVPLAPGGTGWVNAKYVIAQNATGLPVLPSPPVPPTTALIPPEPTDPQVKALTEVYVRSGPGTQYPAYGVAKTGAVARVIGKSQDGGWWTVRVDPTMIGLGYAWVAAAYVQASNTGSVPVVAAPPPPPPVTPQPPAAGAPTATAIDYVNLRSGPGTNYYILGVANPGATGEITGISQDGAWWQVKVPADRIPGGLAWVSADWVTATNTSSVPIVAAPPPPPTDISTTPPSASQCVLVSQTPADNTTYPTSYGFQATWVVKNTSNQAWSEGEVDLVFLGAINGQRLHQNGDLYDLDQKVQPGEQYRVSIPMITPPNPGQYGEAWTLRQGSSNILCNFWVIVNAQ